MTAALGLFFKGVVIGLANIIPGVSGGTMALVLGIYQRLIRSISRFRLRTVRELWGALRSRERRSRLSGFLERYDLTFLALLATGALAAIAATSRLMAYLLEEHHSPTYGFFFGLVAASLVVPWTLLKRRSWKELVSALVAAALTVCLSNALSSDTRLEVEREKVALEAEERPAPERQEALSAWRLLFVFAVGAVAISAMILPGVSGSFILLLFGAYFDILLAIDGLLEFSFAGGELRPAVGHALTLGAFGLGCLIGIGLFTRLIAFLLDRFYSPTMAFLAGLMVGSLWNLWPFKQEAHVGSKTFHLGNILPAGAGAAEIATALAVVFGASLALGFALYERKGRRAQCMGSMSSSPKSPRQSGIPS